MSKFNHHIRRAGDKVPLDLARARLVNYARDNGPGPHQAATLAEVIWPDGKWIAPQGAGAAASRVLKALGFKWTGGKRGWGWMIA